MHLSFCSQVSILPGIELCRSDVNLLNVVWAIHGSAMFIILAIVLINFQFTPRCRSNFTGQVEPSWSMLQALRLFNSFFSSLSLLQSANTWTQSKIQNCSFIITCQPKQSDNSKFEEHAMTMGSIRLPKNQRNNKQFSQERITRTS